VTVDDAPLDSEQIIKGYLTLSDINADHTIIVKSAAGTVTTTYSTLSVTVTGGKGHVEYSLGDSVFTDYVLPVIIPDNSEVVIRAVPDEGYSVRSIITHAGTVPERTSETAVFRGVVSSIQAEVQFGTGSDGGILWLAAVIALTGAVIVGCTAAAVRRRRTV
jgi:hypothetical protein